MRVAKKKKKKRKKDKNADAKLSESKRYLDKEVKGVLLFMLRICLILYWIELINNMMSICVQGLG